MGRKNRRKVKVQDEESEDGPASSDMSPNTRKEYEKSQIMKADLGLATADHIKTSDYRRPIQQNFDLVRLCDEEGSEERKLAVENKVQTSQWLKWGNTEEARNTASGDRQLGTGNTHRRALAESLAETSRQAGHALTLADTYHDRGSKHPKGDLSITAGKRTISVEQAIPKGPAKKSISEMSAFKKKPRPTPLQGRPWPPSALEGSPFLSAPAQPISFGKIPTPQPPFTAIATTFQAGTTIDQLRPPKSAVLPSPRLRSRQCVPLVDASTFMSSATNMLASRPQSKMQESPAGTSLSNTAAAPVLETQADPRQEGGGIVTQSAHNESAIRKVPVTEFSFSADAALANTQVSTHTDGAPSSAVLSGFSPAAESERLVKDANGSQFGTPLVGLGIQGPGFEKITSTKPSLPPSPLPTGLSSQNGSLLDSPILEDMGGSVLVADKSKEKEVVVIDGVRYIPESRLLAFKQSIEKRAITIREDPLSPVSHKEAPPIKPEVQIPPLALSTNEPAKATVEVPTKPINPFESRGTAPEKTSDPVVPHAVVPEPSQVPQRLPLTLDEALVVAVNSPLAALITQGTAKASAKAKATKHAIVSKWAAPPGEVYESHQLSKDISQIDLVDSESVDASSQVKQPVLQSKSTNGGHWGKKPKHNPFEAVLARVESESASSAGEKEATNVIGDQNAFKAPAKHAAKSSMSVTAPAASYSAPKRYFAAPGPGYALLLADLVQKEPSTSASTFDGESDDEEL
ncbi:hypothetical protein LTS17_007241 [Exophiala oligosperma]